MSHDPIDDLLREVAPIPDVGFTERVMAALPPARPASSNLERWLPALAAGLAAAALAPDAAQLARLLADGSADLGTGLAQALAAASPGGALAGGTGLLALLLAAGTAALGCWRVAAPTG
jgi:hypothetical protein